MSDQYDYSEDWTAGGQVTGSGTETYADAETYGFPSTGTLSTMYENSTAAISSPGFVIYSPNVQRIAPPAMTWGVSGSGDGSGSQAAPATTANPTALSNPNAPVPGGESPEMPSSDDPAIRDILDLEARAAYDAANGGTNQAYLKRKIYDAKQAFYQSAAATQDEINAARWAGALEGAQGGLSNTTDILTFGGSDKIGLTNSSQYQGQEYQSGMFAAQVGRDALLFAAGDAVVKVALRAGANIVEGTRLAKLAETVPLPQAADEMGFWAGPGAEGAAIGEGRTVLSQVLARTEEGQSFLRDLTAFGDKGKLSLKPWELVSERLATGASGDVHVFVSSRANPASIFFRIEEPILKTREAMGEITSILRTTVP